MTLAVPERDMCVYVHLRRGPWLSRERPVEGVLVACSKSNYLGTSQGKPLNRRNDACFNRLLSRTWPRQNFRVPPRLHIGFSIPGGGTAGIGVWRLLGVFPGPRPLFIILPRTVTSSHASENMSSSIPSCAS